MKRWIAMTLALLCLAAPALGEDVWDAMRFDWRSYDAVAAGDTLADKVSLRGQPDENAPSLAELYCATPLLVDGQTVDAAGVRWARVILNGRGARGADLSGYVPIGQLLLENYNYTPPRLRFTAAPLHGKAYLRAAPGDTAETTALVTDWVYVLADMGEEWRFVIDRASQRKGYIRSEDLTPPGLLETEAYLIPGDGREQTVVCADPERREPIAAYYSGMICQVTDISREGGWAAVTVSGVSDWEEEEGQPIRRYFPVWGDLPPLTIALDMPVVKGYVSLAEVKAFLYPWQVEYGFKTGMAVKELKLTDEADDFYVPQGAFVTVLGQVGAQYHVSCDRLNTPTRLGLAYQDLIELTERPATNEGPERLGYLRLEKRLDDEGRPLGTPTAQYPGEEKNPFGEFAETDELWAEIIGEIGDWYQVRQYHDANFYVEKDRVAQAVRNEELWHEAAFARTEEVWTASGEDAGLWLWTVAAGERAQLALTFQGEEALPEEYLVQAESAPVGYTVYIPAGTRVFRTGGAMEALTEDGVPAVLPAHPSDYPDHLEIFSGSGRFFCDAQLPSFITYFGYCVRPVPGAEDSYFAVSDLLFRMGEDGGAADDRIEAFFLEEGEAYVDLHPGQFLELHNCVLSLFFGNG